MTLSKRTVHVALIFLGAACIFAPDYPEIRRSLSIANTDGVYRIVPEAAVFTTCKYRSDVFMGVAELDRTCVPKAQVITTNSFGDLCDSRNWQVQFHSRQYDAKTDTTAFSYFVTNDKDIPENAVVGASTEAQPNTDISSLTLGWKGTCCLVRADYWGDSSFIRSGENGIDPETCVSGIKFDQSWENATSVEEMREPMHVLTFLGDIPLTGEDETLHAITGGNGYCLYSLPGADCSDLSVVYPEPSPTSSEIPAGQPEPSPTNQPVYTAVVDTPDQLEKDLCKYNSGNFQLEGTRYVDSTCVPFFTEVKDTSTGICVSENWDIQFLDRIYKRDLNVTEFRYLVSNPTGGDSPREIDHVIIGWRGNCCIESASYWANNDTIFEGTANGIDPSTCVAGLVFDQSWTFDVSGTMYSSLHSITMHGEVSLTKSNHVLTAIEGGGSFCVYELQGADCDAHTEANLPEVELTSTQMEMPVSLQQPLAVLAGRTNALITGLSGQQFKFNGHSGSWYSFVSTKSFQWNTKLMRSQDCPDGTDLFVAGVGLVVFDDDGYAVHRVGVNVLDESLKTVGCGSFGGTNCLGRGSLEITIDGAKYQSPGDHKFTDGTGRVIAYNTISQCRRKWYEFRVEGDLQRTNKLRNRNLKDQSVFEILDELEDTMADTQICKGWLDRRHVKGDLFDQPGHSGEWITVLIKTDKVSLHIEYKKQSNRCNADNLNVWISAIKSDVVEEDWEGALGETKASHMGRYSTLKHGTDEAYEVRSSFSSACQSCVPRQRR